eukprot:COSAG02_NODE_4133_length_5737_cov_4.247960_4_plen_98_part_00
MSRQIRILLTSTVYTGVYTQCWRDSAQCSYYRLQTTASRQDTNTLVVARHSTAQGRELSLYPLAPRKGQGQGAGAARTMVTHAAGITISGRRHIVST